MKVIDNIANTCAEGMKNEHNTVSMTASYSACCKLDGKKDNKHKEN